MAANPTAVVTTINDIVINPDDPTKVDFIIEFRMMFVPNDDSPPLLAQATLTVNNNFSKQDVRAAAFTAIEAKVIENGGTISSNRIFGVDDLV
jgi:hypothetical protein